MCWQVDFIGFVLPVLSILRPSYYDDSESMPKRSCAEILLKLLIRLSRSRVIRVRSNRQPPRGLRANIQ